jgi:hypothetical protein
LIVKSHFRRNGIQRRWRLIRLFHWYVIRAVRRRQVFGLRWQRLFKVFPAVLELLGRLGGGLR